MQPRIIPVILAGGSGERLWPVSKHDFPKQFVAFGGAKQSLFQQTLARVANRALFAPPLIVCHDSHRFIVTDQLNAIHCDDATLIVEPRPRNTAPALLLAACHAARIAPGSTLLVLPADHQIDDQAAFLDAVARGVDAAQEGWFVTFACTATTPETGYGYIEIGAPITSASSVRRIASFTEKPDRARAETYLAAGNYGWNSGMFMLGLSALFDSFAQLAPDMLAACKAAYDQHTVDLDFIRPDARALIACPSISIDCALMEKTDRGAVIPVDMGWCDLGSWAALHTLGARDSDGNGTHGNVLTAECEGCYIHATESPIAAIGLRDLVIVSANNALLVVAKDRLDSIKPLLQRMQPAEMEHTEYAHRPWGNFERIDRGVHYQVKKLTLKPGAKISLQSHAHRAEHWVVVEGRATVTNGEQVYTLEQHQSTFIPAGAVHRLENREAVPLIVIEIQTGTQLDEADITRLEDVYNRE